MELTPAAKLVWRYRFTIVNDDGYHAANTDGTGHIRAVKKRGRFSCGENHGAAFGAGGAATAISRAIEGIRRVNCLITVKTFSKAVCLCGEAGEMKTPIASLQISILPISTRAFY